MEIFIDSGSLRDIQTWMDQGIVDGVTTNPSILLKDGGYDVEARAKEIATLIHPRPLSVEVFTNDRDEMIVQAKRFAQWAPNIVVKVPVINEDGAPCLNVVRRLEQSGVHVNVTACLSFGQVVLAAKSGATYISIFAGRAADEGHDASKLVRESVDWLRAWGYASKIIVGSIREVINLQDAALAGAHIVTIPPQFLAKWVDHQYTRATVRGFHEDAKKALLHSNGAGILR